MVKYMIDQSVIDARRAKKGEASEKIIEIRLAFTGAYRGELVNLANQVVIGLGSLRAMQYTGGTGKEFSFYIVGFESDVRQAKLLINSLQIQAAVAVRDYWKLNKATYAGESTYNQEKVRRSFVHGFGGGAGRRIQDSRKQAVSESSTGTELVLVDRRAQVDTYMGPEVPAQGSYSQRLRIGLRGWVRSRTERQHGRQQHRPWPRHRRMNYSEWLRGLEQDAPGLSANWVDAGIAAVEPQGEVSVDSYGASQEDLLAIQGLELYPNQSVRVERELIAWRYSTPVITDLPISRR